MSIELIREGFKVEESKGKNDTQALVETEVFLTGDIGKVLLVQGKVDILNVKLIKGKVVVNGTTRFNVLYDTLDEDNNAHPHVQEAIKDFREEIEIDGIDDNMIAKVDSKIEYIEHNLEESKVQLNALVNLSAEVEEYKTIEAIKEINSKDGLETMKEDITYKEMFGRGVSHANINDVINLGDDYPEIDEVIKFTINTKEIEAMVAEDRIITSGEVLVNLIYYGEETINSYKTTIPFNHFIEMLGATSELDQTVEYEVAEGNYEIMGNEIGQRKILNLDIKVKVTGKAFQDKTRELIIDAYSIKEKLLIKREEMSVKESLLDIDQIEDISLSIKEVDAQEVLDIETSATIIGEKFVENGVEVEGLLSVNLVYLDRISEEIMSYNMDYPFKSTMYDDIDPESSIEVHSNIEDVDFSIRKDGLEVDCRIALTANLSKNRKIHTIKEIEETEELIDKSNAPSITIYIVQKGDTLWDIAKRYNSTQEDIITSNKLETAEINVGDKIIIEKKVEEIAV